MPHKTHMLTNRYLYLLYEYIIIKIIKYIPDLDDGLNESDMDDGRYDDDFPTEDKSV